MAAQYVVICVIGMVSLARELLNPSLKRGMIPAENKPQTPKPHAPDLRRIQMLLC